MEKASTPRSRLTRSAAKQVNTPKIIDEEGGVEKDIGDDIKQNMRKTRRKSEAKPKTNGSTSASGDIKKIKNAGEISDGNSLDGYDSEDSNTSAIQRGSPNLSSNKTSPAMPKRSLRTRRSITPGPDVESSAPKRIRRSTSEEQLSSPKPKRCARAKSESKDFVFTPTKENANSKFVQENSALRKIDIIVEANEEELKEELAQLKKEPQILSNTITEAEPQDLVEEVKNTPSKPEENDGDEKVCNSVETHNVESEMVNNINITCNTEHENSGREEDDKEIEFGKDLTKLTNVAENVSDRPVENTINELPITEAPESKLIQDKCDLINKPAEEDCNIETEMTLKDNDIANNEESNADTLSEKNNIGCEDSSIKIDITCDDDTEPAQEILHVDLPSPNKYVNNLPNNQNTITLKDEESLPDVQPGNMTVTDNNNVKSLKEHIEIKLIETSSEDEAISNPENVKIIEALNSSKCKEDQESNNNGNNQRPISPIVINFSIVKDDVVETIHSSDDTENEDKTEIKQYNRESNEEIIVSDCDKLNLTYEKTSEKDYCNDEGFQIETNTDKCCDLNLQVEEEDEDIHIEDGYNDNDANENQLSHLATKTEDRELLSVEGEDQSKVTEIEDTPIEQYGSLNTETIIQDEEHSISPVLIEEENKPEILDRFGKDEMCKINKKGTMIIKLSIEDDVNEKTTLEVLKETDNSENYLPLDENYDEGLYDDGTCNKGEFDSASDGDIYKDMSDIDSDVDEKKHNSVCFSDSSEQRAADEKKLGNQVFYSDSSEHRAADEKKHGKQISSGSEQRSDSTEEYGGEVASFSSDEEEETEEKIEEENVPSKAPQVAELTKKNIETNSKESENLFDKTSPMTYDRALAIINKNRIKKIDDEEFFDMFTQELNRVSEESGSDSDIAIVDEYIMEPEEPVNKPGIVQKSGNPQANPKPPQRPAPPPQSMINQHMPPSEQFAGNYNQQIPPQQNHSIIPRVNYSQGGMYHHYNQGMPPVNAIRAPIMYDQFAVPSTSMSDPRLFNAHVPPDGHFTAGGMFNHSVGPPVSDAPLHYPSVPTLKIRNIHSMSNSHFSSIKNQDYATQEQGNSGVGLEMNTPRNLNESKDNANKSIRISTATMTETDDKLEQAAVKSSPSKVSSKTNTPILKLLGLDKDKLKLLKQALGLSKKKRVVPKQKMAIQKRILLEQIMKSQKKELIKQSHSESKKQIRKRRHRSNKSGKSREETESDSTFSPGKAEEPGSENSSEETTSTDHSSSDSFTKARERDSSSSEETVESKDREVNLEQGSVSITINTRPRKLSDRSSNKCIKENVYYVSSGGKVQKSLPKRSKYTLVEKSPKIADTYEIHPKKKMTQGKRKNKKQSTLLQSKCGTFTVDPLTATSQSSDTEESADEQFVTPMEELKRSLRRDIVQGKNKLSNMFSLQSLNEQKAGSKWKVDERSEKSGRKEKARKVNKLPAAFLEELARESGKCKRDQLEESASEDVPRKRRKLRKRASKLKVKSAAAEEAYVPLITAGATQFSLSRLDKDRVLTIAEKAAKFRSDQLYGSSVKRITSNELMNIKKKQKRMKFH